ncbi:MAG TPA: urate hydroxylase PuuD, partial [Alcaligenes faecalis]|nr:urate hydroxylase PuuD [Alcaligenes faecalis]
MATSMSANVFFWIIPGQRRMVKALKAGQAPNPLDGKRGKQRSVHNTYFTLPVLLLMLSNHYSFTYNNPNAWIIMVLFIFAGALIRQYFVLMHAGIKKPAYPAAGVVLLLIVGYLAAPANLKGEVASAPAAGEAAETITVARVQEIMDARCVQCHAVKPNADFGFTAAPAGMLLDTIDNTVLHAEQVKTVVHSKYMPLGNMTQMTDEERAAIAAWSGTRD